MLQIKCPWCGIRDEDEFTCGGQSHITRPANPEKASDEQWAAYLFDRANPKGISLERWHHSFGCRQWFNIARHTVSHEIKAIYSMSDPMPTTTEDSRIESGNKPVVELTQVDKQASS